jgi:carboxylate-amine ligase
VDTGFNSARLNVVNAVPLTGLPPNVPTWTAFEEYFERLRVMGVVESMKDFYWDIRPKPEYGTVEVRVFDTPLSVERAAALAGYAQTLAAKILDAPDEQFESHGEVYAYNRFLACRYGLDAEIIDPRVSQRRTLHQDIASTLDEVETLAHSLGAGAAIAHLRAIIGAGVNDSTWLRLQHAKASSLNEVARLQSERWMGEREVAPVA